MSSVAQALGMSDQVVVHIIEAQLNLHVIRIFTYGLYTMIFLSTLRKLSSQDGWPPQRVVLTVVICVIWVLATISMGFAWNSLVSTYIAHGQTQDSILGYIVVYGDGTWSSKRMTINIMDYTIVAFNAILAELINIWRCWELYHRNWLVVSLPLLGVLCGLVSHIFNMVETYISPSHANTTLSTVNWNIVYYSVTASTNILTTTLIIFRILSVAGLKSARTYRGLLEILVESAFVFSATYIVFLALFVRDVYLPYWSDTSYYVQGLLNAVTAAAPTMIVERVLSGEARPNDSWTRSSLPRMRSTMRSLAESIRFTSFRPARTQHTIATLDTVSRVGGVEDGIVSLVGIQEESDANSRGSEVDVEKRGGAEGA